MDTPPPRSDVAPPTPPSPPSSTSNDAKARPPAKARRGVNLPGWLAVLILIGVAGGFGYLGWRLLAPDPKIDLSQYEPNDTGRGRRFFGGNAGGGGNNGGGNRQNAPQVVRGTPVPPQPVEGVTLESNGNGTARIKGLDVRFLVSNAKPIVVATAPPRQNMDPNDTLASRVRVVAISQTDRRTAAGVTDEQAKKLRELQFPKLPVINQAARETLLGIWAELRAADAAARANVEKKLLDTLRETAAVHAAADAAAFRTTADQIRQILTPEQIEKLRRPNR